MQSHAPFLCKFCGQARIFYHVGKEQYVDFDTLEKHVCKSNEGTGYYITVTSDTENKHCFFCHYKSGKRIAVHYQTIMPDRRRRNLVQVVCERCSKKMSKAFVDYEFDFTE